MSKQLKKKKQKETKKISSPFMEQRCFNNNQYLSFCFRAITNNSHYNFDYFGVGRRREELKARKELDKLLLYISHRKLVDLIHINKRALGGFETLYKEQIHILDNSNILSKESKIHVFRFNGDEYRLLCYKRSNCNTFLVLGYDFDHSAYRH